MLIIDGSQGEGGGQILRTALSLSACLNRPFRIINIRSARSKPGLRPQHLVAVQAAASIAAAQVEGDAIGSQTLTFVPGAITAGEYSFDIGTAGSTTLVLQTVLPALLAAKGPSRLILEGGTHNPMAPPFEFLQHAFLPLINRMGPNVSARLERSGYFPAGGGLVEVQIAPVTQLGALNLPERGAVRDIRATATVANLPEHIARRELQVLQQQLNLESSQLSINRDNVARGPGNIVVVQITCEHVTEVYAAFGKRGVRAETVANRLAQRVRHYLAADVAVGDYLADQLLVPLALAGNSSFLTMRPTRHTLTNIDVIRSFIDVDISLEEVAQDRWRVVIS